MTSNEVIDASIIGNGRVVFIKEVAEIPTTSKTTGSVTVNNWGQPGKPAHYMVTFPNSAVTKLQLD